MPLASIELLQRYYVAFNSGDMGAFLSLLAEDVVHDINQGGREQGREAFAGITAGRAVSVHLRLRRIDIMASASPLLLRVPSSLAMKIISSPSKVTVTPSGVLA